MKFIGFNQNTKLMFMHFMALPWSGGDLYFEKVSSTIVYRFRIFAANFSTQLSENVELGKQLISHGAQFGAVTCGQQQQRMRVLLVCVASVDLSPFVWRRQLVVRHPKSWNSTMWWLVWNYIFTGNSIRKLWRTKNVSENAQVVFNVSVDFLNGAFPEMWCFL